MNSRVTPATSVSDNKAINSITSNATKNTQPLDIFTQMSYNEGYNLLNQNRSSADKPISWLLRESKTIGMLSVDFNCICDSKNAVDPIMNGPFIRYQKINQNTYLCSSSIRFALKKTNHNQVSNYEWSIINGTQLNEVVTDSNFQAINVTLLKHYGDALYILLQKLGFDKASQIKPNMTQMTKISAYQFFSRPVSTAHTAVVETAALTSITVSVANNIISGEGSDLKTSKPAK